MDIQTRKINFVQEFLRLRNIKLIEKLERILPEDKAKTYSEDYGCNYTFGKQSKNREKGRPS